MNLDRLEGCYQSGYRAWVAKLPRKPAFVKGSEAYHWWLNGWDDARHEHEDAPPEDE